MLINYFIINVCVSERTTFVMSAMCCKRGSQSNSYFYTVQCRNESVGINIARNIADEVKHESEAAQHLPNSVTVYTLQRHWSASSTTTRAELGDC